MWQGQLVSLLHKATIPAICNAFITAATVTAELMHSSQRTLSPGLLLAFTARRWAAAVDAAGRLAAGLAGIAAPTPAVLVPTGAGTLAAAGAAAAADGCPWGSRFNLSFGAVGVLVKMKPCHTT